VLVIIGLIIGGVLVGRDLINAAKLRRIVTAEEQYVAAINTFRVKYNCLPGDCVNATTLFTTTQNGNNDGAINANTDTAYGGIYWLTGIQVNAATPDGPVEEVTLANEHLAKAGLIKVPVFNRSGAVPNNSDVWFVNLGSPGLNLAAATTLQGRNIVRMGAPQQWPGASYIGFGYGSGLNFFTPEEGFYIDNKADDGLPMTGKVIAEESANILRTGNLGLLTNYGCVAPTSSGAGTFNNAYNFTHLSTQWASMAKAPCAMTFYDAF